MAKRRSNRHIKAFVPYQGRLDTIPVDLAFRLVDAPRPLRFEDGKVTGVEWRPNPVFVARLGFRCAAEVVSLQGRTWVPIPTSLPHKVARAAIAANLVNAIVAFGVMGSVERVRPTADGSWACYVCAAEHPSTVAGLGCTLCGRRACVSCEAAALEQPCCVAMPEAEAPDGDEELLRLAEGLG